MGILKILFLLLLLLFPIAEVGRYQFPNGVAVSLNDLILFITFSYWIFYKIRNNSKFKFGFLGKPLFLFTLFAFISLFLNILNLNFSELLISLSYLLRFLLYASLYFIVKDFDTKFKHKASVIMLFSGFMTILIGFVQYFLYPSLRNLSYLGWDEHLYRMFSSFLDPNFFGTFSVLFFIFTVGFLKVKTFKNSIFKQLVVFLIGFLSLISVYLTYSRGALIMLLVSVFVYLYFIGLKKLIVFTFIIFTLLIFISPKSFETEGTNLLRTVSVTERLSSAKVGIDIFLSNPVFGVGFNAYRYAQNKIGLNNSIWQVTHSGAGTDNSFIFVAATTGIVGLVSYTYLIYKIILLAKLNISKNKYGIILLSVFLGLIANSLFINSLFYVLILEWIFIIAAFTENS